MYLHRISIKAIVLLIFGFLCIFSVLYSTSNFKIIPDASGYITASQNLIRTGRIFVFANSPSWRLEPAVEPYTEQPPGMPYYLAPFLIIFNNPVTAAAVAQAVAIVLLYAGVYILTEDFQAHPLIQIAAAAAFTFFWPQQGTYNSFLSETLFTGLSLWAVHFLVQARHSLRPRRMWVTALLLAAAASTTRAIGVFYLPVFLLTAILGKKNILVWSAASAAATLGPITAWSVRNQLLYGATSSTHGIHSSIDWGKLTVPVFYLVDLASPFPVLVACAALLVLISLLAPFYRPEILERWGGRLNIDFSKIRWYSPLLTVIALILIASSLAADRLGFGGSPGLGLKQITVIGVGAVLAVGAWAANTNLGDYLRQWIRRNDRARWQERPFTTYILLLAAGGSQLIGLTLLSTITFFNPLDDGRILTPALCLLILAFLAGLDHLARLFRKPILRWSIFILAIGLAAVSPAFGRPDLKISFEFPRPPEERLWQALSEYPGFRRSTHFFSDHNFTHQIYANRPQRIILVKEWIAKPGFLEHYLLNDQCPFVLVNQGTETNQVMDDEYARVGLNRYELVDGAFVLYANDCLTSP